MGPHYRVKTGGAPSTIPGKINALTQSEQKALEEFVKEHLAKGYMLQYLPISTYFSDQRPLSYHYRLCVTSQLTQNP